jgi:hypothetical protein
MVNADLGCGEDVGRLEIAVDDALLMGVLPMSLYAADR